MAGWIYIAFMLLLWAWVPDASGLQDAGDFANESIGHRTVVSSSEILAQLESNQPVAYNNVSVSGNLDLSRLGKRIRQTIRITNSTFLGSVNFDHITFEDLLDLKGTTFQRTASFNKTQYIEDSLFTGTKFLGNAYFRFAGFEKPVSFSRARFERAASFANSQFGSNANFERVEFAQDADFELAQFHGPVIFRGTLFLGETIFSNSHFEGAAFFKSCRYDGNASFAGARFLSDVSFSSARFYRSAIFGLANFGGFSDFISADFQDVAYFAGTKFTDSGYFLDAKFNRDLVLENARIYSMQLDNVTFGNESMIDLNKADYTRLVVPWKSIRSRLVFNGAAYLALVKNYKNLEWFEDADDCYFQYRRIDQESKSFGWSKLIDIISWLSCGYGVRVSYTVFWCIFTIFFFGMLFWAGNGMRKFEREGLEIPGSPIKGGKRVSLIDALYFSTAMFTTSQAPVNTYPVRHYRHLAMAEGIMGWFFLGLFVVVLSGLLIR